MKDPTFQEVAQALAEADMDAKCANAGQERPAVFCTSRTVQTLADLVRLYQKLESIIADWTTRNPREFCTFGEWLVDHDEIKSDRIAELEVKLSAAMAAERERDALLAPEALARLKNEVAAKVWEEAAKMKCSGDACNPPNFIPQEIRNLMLERAAALRAGRAA